MFGLKIMCSIPGSPTFVNGWPFALATFRAVKSCSALELRLIRLFNYVEPVSFRYMYMDILFIDYHTPHRGSSRT
jgi:hypothetical protein